jgi:hypothetical protein
MARDSNEPTVVYNDFATESAKTIRKAVRPDIIESRIPETAVAA